MKWIALALQFVLVSSITLAADENAPKLGGTRWAVSYYNGLNAKTIFEFGDDGTFSYGRGYSGTWKLDGTKVTMRSTDGINEFSGTVNGDVMQGKGKNTGKKDLDWEWKGVRIK
jgi:hypothetical protein